MIAWLISAAHGLIDASVLESRRGIRVQQQMVDSKAGIARPPVSARSPQSVSAWRAGWKRRAALRLRSIKRCRNMASLICLRRSSLSRRRRNSLERAPSELRWDDRVARALRVVVVSSQKTVLAHIRRANRPLDEDPEEASFRTFGRFVIGVLQRRRPKRNRLHRKGATEREPARENLLAFCHRAVVVDRASMGGCATPQREPRREESSPA